MTNLGLFFWQICQKHLPNREKGVQENPQAFLYPENKTIFSRYIRIRCAARAMEASSSFRAGVCFFSLNSAPALLFLNYIYRKV